MAVSSIFHCPHCGAQYRCIEVQLQREERDMELCSVCDRMMASWDGHVMPIFELVQPPPPPTYR